MYNESVSLFCWKSGHNTGSGHYNFDQRPLAKITDSTTRWALTCVWPNSSCVIRNALQQASIKRCYTGRPCLELESDIHTFLHIWQSTGLRLGLFWGHKYRKMNFKVSRCSASIVWRARRDSALFCWKIYWRQIDFPVFRNVMKQPCVCGADK